VISAINGKKMPKEKRNLVAVSHHNLEKFLIVPYPLQIIRLHICYNMILAYIVYSFASKYLPCPCKSKPQLAG
jgi:hypothetical protein